MTIQRLKGVARSLGVLAGACAMLAMPCATASAQNPNLPPPQVYARAYAQWSIVGQQANTYTFNGGMCNNSPYNNGNTPSFFVFSGTQAGSSVYYPVAILDANPTLSEIVTPSSTTNTQSVCGFSGSTTNSHTSFTLVDGTGGLQPAVTTQTQSPMASLVLLDRYWYTTVFGLPGQPTPESIIKAVTGNANVSIADTTTSPWTFWRWNPTTSAYAAVALTGGSSAPTAAAGAAAGTSPTISNSGDGNTFTVSLTAGTSTTTGTLFTETWATSNAFTYSPTCNVWSSGTNSFTGFTYAVTFPSSTHAVLTVTVPSGGTAPTASTAYAFKVVCG